MSSIFAYDPVVVQRRAVVRLITAGSRPVAFVVRIEGLAQRWIFPMTLDGATSFVAALLEEHCIAGQVRYDATFMDWWEAAGCPRFDCG